MNEPGPITRRIQAWQRQRADSRLFRHLAHALELDLDDQELLVAIADQHQLVRTSEVFLRPTLFAQSPLPDRWSDARLAALRQRLFDPHLAPSR
ncbi:MAG: hypothetical protein AB7O52_14470 [Planctomycetota bacterium]